MGAILQLIIGVLLIATQCSTKNISKLRQIREAPPPSPAPIQNVTEINNRDLNKIVKDNPKTEPVDSKTKFVNNVHNYEDFPLKLSRSKEEKPINPITNETTEDVASSKEQKRREDSSRAIDVEASKLWTSDFHSKNSVTIRPAPDIEKFQEPTALSFEGTKHPNLERNIELTTPASTVFDQKYKETVESVEQNIEVDDIHEHEEDESKREHNSHVDFNVDDPFKKLENESLEFIKTKAIVNNDTVNKNSIHKDVNFEQTKKIDYESVFNDTKVYDEDSTKDGQNSTEKTSATTFSSTPSLPVATTKKSLLKEVLTETSNSHILSNNIEIENTKPVKGVSTSPITSTTTRDLKDITVSTEQLQITTPIPRSEKLSTEAQNITTTSTRPATVSENTATITTTTSSSLITIPLQKLNISEEENHVIPLQLGSDRTPIQESTSDPSLTLNTSTPIASPSMEVRVALDDSKTSTTEVITSTTASLPTTTFDSSMFLSDTTFFEEGTTRLVIENTTELSDPTESFTTDDATTDVIDAITTTESAQRTSKSLETVKVTEQMDKTNEIIVENSTKAIDLNASSTVSDRVESTTEIDDIKTKNSTDNIIEKAGDSEETTTEEITTSTVEITTIENTSQYTTPNDSGMSKTTTEEQNIFNTTEKSSELPPSTTTEMNSTTLKEKDDSTTTEYVFVHIENGGSNHTTLLPEILSPILNYSTTVAVDNEGGQIRKIIVDETGTKVTDNSNSSTTTSGSTVSTTTTTTTQEVLLNLSTTTEEEPETPTENGLENSKDGGNKGKIAAIAISSVGAVCLVLLAGLLYVMKKRQKRLNYGPRCRPVSLDDYSIDNLSVYNSVRRKGGARLSKRSFGNPAFEDPVAPSHPLNFPAVALFSNNSEDIKAEFDDIPQISARTSELPEGCETKNRYANVIPLPETRVFLKPIDGYPNSDYINANYVTGPKNTKGYYIATQGPMQNTVDDFWRMIWEQQAKVILMLTHLVENGLEKSVDYLPESEVLDCSRLFGDFQIILKKQEVKDKYIISTLQLKNMVSNSWREVTHFWYLGWPEKGVPAEGNSLIAFLIEARSYMKTDTIDKRDGLNGVLNGGAQNEHNPVVIHCSPGTGRTGVAIACDLAIREFETTRLVDIPKIVYRIRRDRAGAVQTKEQYLFIYKVVSLYATKLTGEDLETFVTTINQ